MKNFLWLEQEAAHQHLASVPPEERLVEGFEPF
jgi:hypothetical protein